MNLLKWPKCTHIVYWFILFNTSTIILNLIGNFYLITIIIIIIIIILVNFNIFKYILLLSQDSKIVEKQNESKRNSKT